MTEWTILHNPGLRADASGSFFGTQLLDRMQKFTYLCPIPCCCGSWWAASSASSVKSPLFIKPVKWLLFNKHISVPINLMVPWSGILLEQLSWLQSCQGGFESDFKRGFGHLHLLHGLGRMRMAKTSLWWAQKAQDCWICSYRASTAWQRHLKVT